MKVGVLLLTFILLCSTVLTGQFVDLVNAQTGSTITVMPVAGSELQQPRFSDPSDPNITITSDGRIVGIDWIERQGDVYTFYRGYFGYYKS
jgi:hypothetical protein